MKPKTQQSLIRGIHDRLLTALGPQHWWPAESPTEVVIGAILTQNTAWANVVRAIENLRQVGALDWSVLRNLGENELADLIRPSGTYRVKARRLKSFVGCLWDDHGGSLDHLLGGDLNEARQRLLAIAGVGPETADAILLYAGGRPTFVVDAYTRRILRRHYLIEGDESYEAIRTLFHKSLPADATMLNEYHALLVELGKRHCRTRAQCDGCPLADMPHDGEMGE